MLSPGSREIFSNPLSSRRGRVVDPTTQQDLIDNQSKELDSLKNQVKEANDRLDKLEKLLLNVQK